MIGFVTWPPLQGERKKQTRKTMCVKMLVMEGSTL